MGNVSGIELIYWGAAIVGGTLFILRTIMLLAGGGLSHDDFDTSFDGDIHGDMHGDIHADVDADVDADLDIDLDADHADHADHSADSYLSFRLLSLQGLTAFFMMFGLVGLALSRAHLHPILTLAGGILAGLLSVRLIGLLFSQARFLQSDGTLNIQNAVGQPGSVYLTIPAQGTGQVQVTVQGTLRIFDASSKGEQVIKTGEKIRVTGVIDSNTLVVEKIESR